MFEYNDMYIFTTRLIYVVVCLMTRSIMAILLCYFDIIAYNMVTYISIPSPHHLSSLSYNTPGLIKVTNYSDFLRYTIFAMIMFSFYHDGFK